MVIGSLMDMGIQTHSTMEWLGEFGADEIRFKTHMYMYLQHMSVHCIMHASVITTTVFSDATDTFVARLSNNKKLKLKTKLYGDRRRTRQRRQ